VATDKRFRKLKLFYSRLITSLLNICVVESGFISQKSNQSRIVN